MTRPIIFVSSNFPPVTGGSSVVYDQISRSLSSQIIAIGASRHYANGSAFPGLEEQDAARGYSILRLPYLRPPVTLKRASRLQSLIKDDLPVMLRLLAEIVRLIVTRGSRVVCLGDLMSNGWLVFPLRYLLGRRVLIYTHGEEISQEDSSLSGRMRRLWLDHAHAIVSVSDFCKGQIISQHGISADKIFVVPNGVDLSLFSRGPKDFTVLPEAIRGKRILLSVSRLVERKGQDKLIEAMPAILAECPDAHCVIVGQGRMEIPLRETAARCGVEDHVTFLGGVSLDDLVKLYRLCTLFVLPCRTLADGDTEGFGLVFLEANACGAAVVAGAAGGTIEAVSDGENGLVVDGSRPEQISAATLSLLKDEVLAQRLADTGWRRAQSAGWDAAAQQFLEVCRGTATQPANNSYRPAPDAKLERIHPAPARTPLLLTIDVEEQFDWNRFSSIDFQAAGVAALSQFHERCREIGISPVYLVTHAIMSDPGFCTFLRSVLDSGTGEVGVHLHTWNTPPLWEFTNAFYSFQCNLPDYLERRKLETMSRLYEDAFGRPARIHRAGRWGGGDRTAAMLEDLGLDIDLSPCPYFHDKSSGGPDFSALDHRPFWSGNRRSVLTIPVSTVMFARGPAILSRLFGRLPPALDRWMRRTLGTPLRFSPEGQPVERLMYMASELQQHAVAVFTLHSTSLFPSGNPYAKTQDGADEVADRCFDVIKACLASGGFQAATCAGIHAAVRYTAPAAPDRSGLPDAGQR